MALVRSPNRAVPVLGGVALALMVLATMIGNVQAQQGGQSVCDRCISIAWSQANRWPNPCAADNTQTRHACINQYVKKRCWDTGICPNTNPAPGSVASCAGFPQPMYGEIPCPEGITGLCNTECFGLNCSTTDTSKRCQETIRDTFTVGGDCRIDCGCK